MICLLATAMAEENEEKKATIDTKPRGWFLEFLHKCVRGQLVVEAWEARKQGELSTWNLTIRINFSKNLVKKI